jgi:endo-1,4-beta-xylanase
VNELPNPGPVGRFNLRWFKRGQVILAGFLLQALSGSAQNLATNPGFETGTTTGWSAYGPIKISASTAQTHGGSYSGYVTGRTSGAWNGVAQSFVGVMQPGSNYSISAWVRLANTNNSQSVMLTIQKTDGGGTTYQNVASGTATSNAWTQLSGGYTLSVSGTLTALNLYLEGPATNVNYYTDDWIVQDGGAWKTAANERIEQIRKRNVELLIVDPDGNPVPGATISARQTGHNFAFGSAINHNIANPSYAAFFKTNFEWAVMENESKWYANEPSQGNVTYAAADSITNFCYTNGILLRGHCIFWAVDAHVQQWVTNLSNANLPIALTNRLNSAVNHFKGTFKSWDVNNEMLHGNYFGNKLGNWVNPWMFQYAHSLDSNVVLFVNDYNVTEQNETEAYKQQIQNLLASNAPVQGIGSQCHYGSTVDPAVSEGRLDSLSQLGLPIWISEYDSLNSDENVRANNLENLYRLAFSKTNVQGIMMWGFWAGSHWRGSNAAIVNLNWTLNEAGRRYQSLLSEWTTRTNGVTDGGGTYAFRGFQGRYDITVTPPGGQPTLRRITLDPGTGTSVATLIITPFGAQPLLHAASRSPATGSFQFQLTADAGRSYTIQTSTNLNSPDWSPLASIGNPNGTVWFTNSGPTPDPQLFYRAQLLP